MKNAADAIIADITERYGAKVAESKVSLNGERGSIDEEGNIAKAFGKVKAAENPEQMLKEI